MFLNIIFLKFFMELKLFKVPQIMINLIIFFNAFYLLFNTFVSVALKIFINKVLLYRTFEPHKVSPTIIYAIL